MYPIEDTHKCLISNDTEQQVFFTGGLQLWVAVMFNLNNPNEKKYIYTGTFYKG